MTNIFNQMQKNASPYIVVAWPFAVLLVIVSVILMIEDYNTSRLGYEMIPTQKIDTVWLPYMVAAVPQAGQIVFFFIYGRDTKQRWAFATMFALFLVDIATDVYFKSSVGGKFNLFIAPISAIESFFIFTLGSEMLFTLMIGFCFQNFKEFMQVSGGFIGVLLSGLDGLVSNVVWGGDSSEVTHNDVNNFNQKARR